MAGNGTTALELIEEVGALDLLLVCLGGGGLLSGCATAAKALFPEIEIWGVEPAAGDDWAQSYAAGERVRLAQVPRTIADGQQTEAPGMLTWPTVRPLVKGIATVTDDEIRDTMRVPLRADEAGRRAERGVGAGGAADRQGRGPRQARRGDDLRRQHRARWLLPDHQPARQLTKIQRHVALAVSCAGSGPTCDSAQDGDGT